MKIPRTLLKIAALLVRSWPCQNSLFLVGSTTSSTRIQFTLIASLTFGNLAIAGWTATVIRANALAQGVGGGQIVGWTASGNYHAALWTRSTGAPLIDLNPVGSSGSREYGVSGGQQVSSVVDLGYAIDLSYDIRIIVNFSNSSSSPNSDTPEVSGISSSDSDLNGDGAVDLTDYPLVVTSFNSVGDN